MRARLPAGHGAGYADQRFPAIVDAATLVATVEKGEAAVPKRLDYTAQHAFECAAGDDIFALLILDRQRRFPGIKRIAARIGDEQGRFRVDLYVQMASVEMLGTLANQAVMPDRGAPLRCSFPVIRAKSYQFMRRPLLCSFEILKTKQHHAVGCRVKIFAHGQPCILLIIFLDGIAQMRGIRTTAKSPGFATLASFFRSSGSKRSPKR